MPNRRLPMAAWMAAILLATASVSFAAPESLLTPSGDLFVVEEVSRGKAPSVALRVTIYRASGGRQVGLVPGTVDREWDGFPSLTLDPDTGQPALVWSRFNGSDYGLVLSLHDGRRWSAPITLVDTLADEIHPRAFSAPGRGIHVLWRHPGRPDSFYYGLFRAGTGVPLFGPERVTPFLIPSGGALTEAYGGGDDPGIGRGDGSGLGDDGASLDECRGDKTVCRNEASPVDAKASCQKISVGAVIGEAVCVFSRDESGWSRGPCAPANSVDIRAALESLRSNECGK